MNSGRKYSTQSNSGIPALFRVGCLLALGIVLLVAAAAAQSQIDEVQRRMLEVKTVPPAESVQDPLAEVLRSAGAARRAESGQRVSPALEVSEVLRIAAEAGGKAPDASGRNRQASPWAATEPWQENWDTFLDVLAPYLRRGASSMEINAAFDGKWVTWTGTFLMSWLYDSIPMAGMAMNARTLTLADGTPVSAGALILIPEGANLAFWRQKPVGTRLTFRTQLRSLSSTAVIYTFRGSAGDTILMIMTKDAEILDGPPPPPATIAASPATLSFSSTAGGASPSPRSLSVTSSGSAQSFTVAASTNTSGNWLSVSQAGGTTPATVTVSANSGGLRGGTYSGSVRITAAGAANSPLTVSVTLTVIEPPPPPLGPVITGVVDGASFRPVISSGSWVTIQGQNLSATTRTWSSLDFIGRYLPKSLDGVSVRINGKEAAICFISPSQINALAPADPAVGSVSVVVTNRQGSSPAVTANLQPSAPALFVFDPENRRYVAAVHSDGTLAAKPALFGLGTASRSARPGDRLMLFGTGFGPTAPPVSTDEVFSGVAPLANPRQLQILIGGAPATVEYAGLAGNGLYQFNIIVPNVTDGDQSVTAQLGSVSCQPGLFVTVGSPVQGGGDAWQRDWDTFLDVLAPYLRRGASGAEINAAFDGKQVTWTGTILISWLYDSIPMAGMAMNTRTLTLADGTPVSAGALVLIPEGANLAIWRQKSVGTRLTFRTTLRSMSGNPVIYTFRGSTGDTILMILTQDAEIVP